MVWKENTLLVLLSKAGRIQVQLALCPTAEGGKVTTSCFSSSEEAGERRNPLCEQLVETLMGVVVCTAVEVGVDGGEVLSWLVVCLSLVVSSAVVTSSSVVTAADDMDTGRDDERGAVTVCSDDEAVTGVCGGLGGLTVTSMGSEGSAWLTPTHVFCAVVSRVSINSTWWGCMLARSL